MRLGLFSVVLISGFVISCSTTRVGEVILDRFAADTARTVELAEKYNSPDVARCARFLQLATSGIKELAEEKTAGALSSAFKATLLRRLGSEFEDAFASECGAIAAHMLVELGRRAPIPGVN